MQIFHHLAPFVFLQADNSMQLKIHETPFKWFNAGLSSKPFTFASAASWLQKGWLDICQPGVDFTLFQGRLFLCHSQWRSAIIRCCELTDINILRLLFGCMIARN